jgi:hypothetical protein
MPIYQDQSSGGLSLVKVDVPNIATNSNIQTAVTTVDVATNITFTQTTAGVTATLLNPTITTLNKTITLQNLVASTQSLIITAVGGDTFTIGIGQSIEVAWNGTSWKLLNPAQVFPDYVEVSGGSSSTNLTQGVDHIKFDTVNRQIGTSITPDVSTGYTGTINVNSLGRFLLQPNKTYELEGDIGDVGGGAVGNYITYDWHNADTGTIIQTGTGGSNIVGASLSNTNQGRNEAKATFAPTVPTRVELRIRQISGISGYGGQFSSNRARACIKVISGFLPIVGQSVDYGSLIANGSPSYGTVMHTVTTAANISPAAPFASNQTILFNGGTASVVQNGNLPVALATGIQTINKTGVYNIKISASLQANGANDSTVLQLVKNNTTPIAASSGFNAAGGNLNTAHNLTYSGTLNSGDTLDVRVGANGIAAHAIYTFSWTTTQLGSSAITTTTRAIVDADLTTQVATTGADVNLSGLTEFIDTTNSFTPLTGIFIAPRTGFYKYEVAVAYDGNTTDGKYLRIKVNGTTVRTATNQALAGGASLPQIVLSNIVQLTAGDNVVVTFGHSGNVVNTGIPVAIGGVGNHGSYNIEEISATF